MKHWERYVKMKGTARQMGIGCKEEPVEEEGLEDTVLKDRINLIWPKKLKQLLQKWQMASHWGHKIKLNRRVNGKNWNESKADYGVGGGGGGNRSMMPKILLAILIRCDRKFRAITSLIEKEWTGPMMPKQEGSCCCGPFFREADN